MGSPNGKTLIFIPTYNEHENVTEMCRQLLALGLDVDILFMDDNSPDGTGKILDGLAAQHPRVCIIHRSGKLGIGTAHVAGIRYAYEHGYQTLITMDCDFTHSPADIPRLLEKHEGHDVTVGSRHLQEGSLPGWTPLRRFLTWFGHFLTKHLLGMTYDATGAFRIYRLSVIPQDLFSLVKASGYSFFFESLFVLNFNKFSIVELPIVLSARTYGHSKMSWKEAAKSARQVMSLALASRLNPGQFRALQPLTEINPGLNDPQHWDTYWERKEHKSVIAYDFIATIYRRLIIRPNLNRVMLRCFPPGSRLLHAGCGGGQVDRDLQGIMQITALDISASALRQYKQNNPNFRAVKHASIFDTGFPEESFDGVYNLGVLEHFTESQIVQILTEFRRVLMPSGKLVIFWPHTHAPSAYVLHFADRFFNSFLKQNVQFHPAEISLLHSGGKAEELLTAAGMKMLDFKISPRDLFVQAVIVAEKQTPATSLLKRSKMEED